MKLRLAILGAIAIAIMTLASSQHAAALASRPLVYCYTLTGAPT
jgi:hypothetical protein